MRLSTYSRCLLAVTLGLVPLPGRDAVAQSSWDQYHPGSMKAVIAGERDDVMASIRQGFVPLTHVSAAPFPTRALVQYRDSMRPTSKDHLAVLTAWAKSLGSPIDVAAMFKTEVLFREDSLVLWVPTQAVLIDPLRSELHRGDRLTLFVGFAGAQARDSTDIQWVFMVNEFAKQ